MIPTGWYFCATSSEIKPGKILSKQFFGQRLVFWRTQAGKLNVSHATCPHLGSDLGQLGRVCGEYLRCFSHDYTYNGSGDCVATGWGELPNRHDRVLRSFPVQEMGGFILVWYDKQNRTPSWYLPESLFNIPSQHYIRSNFEFEVPMEIINEDNFDVGHLYKWHNVYDVKTTPVQCQEHIISIAHAFKRHSILFKKPLPPPLHFLTKEIVSEYSSTLYGHGLTNSFIKIFNLNIHMQDLIWCTPIHENKTMYTTFVRLLEPEHRSRLRRCLDAVLRPMIFRSCVWRLRKEHKHEGHGFWEKQTKLTTSILTATESQYIDPYRMWCKQFV